MYTLLCIKQITNKDLSYSTGNYDQYPGINHNGKEKKRNFPSCNQKKKWLWVGGAEKHSTAGSEGGGRGHKPRTVDRLSKLEEAR